ncbi:hypothetical protein GCM10009828_051110 [Actinoplanes couchii]
MSSMKRTVASPADIIACINPAGGRRGAVGGLGNPAEAISEDAETNGKPSTVGGTDAPVPHTDMERFHWIYRSKARIVRALYRRKRGPPRLYRRPKNLPVSA